MQSTAGFFKLLTTKSRYKEPEDFTTIIEVMRKEVTGLFVQYQVAQADSMDAEKLRLEL